MPTYLYAGDVRYTNGLYGIDVKPGEQCRVNYFLPTKWTEFQLLDVDVPTPITPHTIYKTIGDTYETITLTGYNYVSVVLAATGSSVGIKFGSPAQDMAVLLSDNRKSFEMAIPENVTYMYIEKVSGTPAIDVLLNTGSALLM